MNYHPAMAMGRALGRTDPAKLRAVALKVLSMSAMAACIYGGIALSSWAHAKLNPPLPVIPNAAAFEATLVCSQFNGLQSFTVADLGKNGDSHNYRITATCTSGHTVTNIIGVK